MRPETYAQRPSSVIPEPPIVIGKLPSWVEAAVASIESNNPKLDSTNSPKIKKDAPWHTNAKNVRKIPTKKILSVFEELKFSLLIVAKVGDSRICVIDNFICSFLRQKPFN